MNKVDICMEFFLPSLDQVRDSIKKCDEYAMDLIRLKKSLEIQIERMEAFGKRIKLEESVLWDRNNRIILRIFEIIDEIESKQEKMDKFAEYIHILLIEAIGREGIMPFEVKPGDPFDPELHKILERSHDVSLPVPSVVRVISRGYIQNGKIVRKSGISINDLGEVSK